MSNALRNGGAGELQKPDAVIFDMDGVLVDSVPFGFEALRRVMARYGLPNREEEHAEFLASSDDLSCASDDVSRWMKRYGTEPARYGPPAPPAAPAPCASLRRSRR